MPRRTGRPNNGSSRFGNRLLPRLMLAAVTAVLTLVFALATWEVTLRLFFKEKGRQSVAVLTDRKSNASKLVWGTIADFTNQMYVDHPYYGFTVRPYMKGSPMGWRLETDRYGFRNANDFDFQDLSDDDASDETVVIGVFGGSAAFGWQIDGNDGTLSAQLQKLINGSSSGTRYRVVNLAIPSSHYPQQFFLISRIIEYVDAIITFDGINEVFVPGANTFTLAQPLPPDFPWGHIYLPLVNRQNKLVNNLSAYALLTYESEYSPDGLLARFSVYNSLRYRSWARRREKTLNILRDAAGANTKTRRHEWSKFTKDVQQLDALVEFGVAQHAKYSRMVDLIAEARGVRVLHVIQPFMFADESIPVESGQALNFEFILARGHPSRHYDRLRAQCARVAGEAASGFTSRYLDLAEALSPDSANWIDFAHPTRHGTAEIANRIHSFLESSDPPLVR